MKKRLFSLLLALIMALSLLPTAWAEDDAYHKSGKCGDDLTWTLDIAKRQLKITGTGEMADYNNYGKNLAPWIEYQSYIQSVIVESGVTSIGKFAFYDCGTITDVQLPDTVTSIGKDAFAFNRKLTHIDLPDSIVSIGLHAFHYCDALTEVVLPAGLKSISEGTFGYCTRLLSVVIPAGVEEIQDEAFYNCGRKAVVQFSGDMPKFSGEPFLNTAATLLYPCTNTTWDPILFADFGGTLTWEKNHGAMDYSHAAVDTDSSTVTGKCTTCRQDVSLTVDQIACKGNEVSLVVSTKVDQTFTISCADGCGITYRCADSSDVTIGGSLYNRSLTYAVTIPSTGLHKLIVSGSVDNSQLTYTVFVRNHKYTSRVTAPTCGQDGYTLHTCSCGDSYRDNTLPATGKHTAKADPAVPASCTKSGLTAGSHCSVCGKVLTAQQTIPALGHDWKKSRTIYRDGASSTHEYTDDVPRAGDCTLERVQEYECTRCHQSYAEELPPLGHDFVYGKCTHCGTGDPSFMPAPPKPAISITASSGKPTLKWSAVPGAEEYVIYRATSSNGSYTYMWDTTSTSYTNTSATPGYTYYYYVKSINANGIGGDPSDIKSITCDCAQPVVTVSCNAASGKPTISWQAVAGATKYYVYRSTDGGKSFAYWDSTTKTSYTNTGAEVGKTYCYKVKAISDKSSYADSALSAPHSITCDCAKPVVSITTSNGHPRLSWNAVTGASKYSIYRSTDGKNFKYYDATAKTGYTNTGAKAGTTYYYKVKAISDKSSYADSAYSSVKSIRAK